MAWSDQSSEYSEDTQTSDLWKLYHLEVSKITAEAEHEILLDPPLVAPLGESLLNFKSVSSWIICFDCLLVPFYTHPNFFNVEAFPGAVRQQIFPRFASISVRPKPQTAEPARRTGRYSVWPCSRDVATITSYLIKIKKKLKKKNFGATSQPDLTKHIVKVICFGGFLRLTLRCQHTAFCFRCKCERLAAMECRINGKEHCSRRSLGFHGVYGSQMTC